MIIFRGGGNRGSNLGVLALSAPTTNYAQIRADKDREMQMLTMMADKSRMDTMRLQSSIAEQRNKYDQIRNLSFLTPDQNRINMVADGLEGQIMEKVKKQYGGNIKKYIEDGTADLDYRNFVNGIKSSDAFQKGNTNKINMATYIEDQKAGKIPMLVGGRQIRDVYSDFMSGATDSFQYGGGYKAPKDWAKNIQNSYGDNKFQKEAASPQRTILELQQEGLTLQEAVDYYTQAGLSKNPIYHKYDDTYEKQKFDEESALRQARTAKLLEPDASKEPKEGNLSVLQSFGQIGEANVDRKFMGTEQKFAVSGPLSKTGIELALNYVNGGFDQKSGYYTLPRNSSLLTVDGTSQVSGISYFSNPRVVLKKHPTDFREDELFLQVDGLMTENEAEKQGSVVVNGKKDSLENDLWTNKYDELGGSTVKKRVSEWGELWNMSDDVGAKYEIKDLLIPMGKNSVFEESAINKQYNIGPKSYMPRSSSNPNDFLYNDEE